MTQFRGRDGNSAGGGEGGSPSGADPAPGVAAGPAAGLAGSSLDAEGVFRHEDITRSIQLALQVWRWETPGDLETFRLVWANPASSVQAGVTEMFMLGGGLPEVLPGFDSAGLAREFADVIGTGSARYVGEILSDERHGMRRCLAVHAFPLPNQCVGVVFEDVTHRWMADEAQRENQARKSAILDSALDAIVTFDHEGGVYEWNTAAERVFGYRRPEVLGKDLIRLLFPASIPELEAKGIGVLLGHGPDSWVGRRLELEADRFDGQRFPVEVSLVRVLKEGAPVYTGFLRDISERKQFEAALQKKEATLLQAQRIGHIGSWELDLATGNLDWSEETFRIFGRVPGTFSPTRELFLAAVAPEDRLKVRRSMDVALRERRSYTVEHRITLPSGGDRTVNERAELELDGRGRPARWAGTVQDVTDRVELETQLRQAQKMESIGQLAGGVAHDFNNILTVIQGHASLLLGGTNLEPPQLSALQQISVAAERAANLTRQLLTFSRKQMMRVRPFDLNETVASASRMLQRILGEDITLHVHHGTGLPLVQGDAGMLEQVLMNLAVNARDAMASGGLLIINTGLAEISPAQARQVAEAYAGRFVCLTVSDTGCGIPLLHLPYIFEPFFTTKEVGKGTGLGLATVYGIIKQHRGWIAVASEVGKGTVFQVYLPIHSGPAAPSLPGPSGELARGGQETILVVEDEEPVRNLVRNILERYGYRVITVASGAAALREWPGYRDRVDLLLADMVMPGGVNGRELARRLQQDKRELKVIYTSGYSTDAMGRDFAVREGLDFLQKPYQPRQLAEMVRACLDGSPPTRAMGAGPLTG